MVLFQDTNVLVPIKRQHTGLSLFYELVAVLPQGGYSHFVISERLSWTFSFQLQAVLLCLSMTWSQYDYMPWHFSHILTLPYSHELMGFITVIEPFY